MIGRLILLLLLPFLLIAGLLYPAYVVVRFLLISKHGIEPRVKNFEKVYWRFVLVVSFVSYVGFVVVFTRPTLMPFFTRFLEGGGLAILVPFLLLDFLLANVLTQERAFLRWQRTQKADSESASKRRDVAN